MLYAVVIMGILALAALGICIAGLRFIAQALGGGAVNVPRPRRCL